MQSSLEMRVQIQFHQRSRLTAVHVNVALAPPDANVPLPVRSKRRRAEGATRERVSCATSAKIGTRTSASGERPATTPPCAPKATAHPTLEPGDLLVAYSDGIPDAINLNIDDFGLDRLIELIDQNRAQPVDAVCRAIFEGVFAFRGLAEAFDDITVLVTRCEALA